MKINLFLEKHIVRALLAILSDYILLRSDESEKDEEVLAMLDTAVILKDLINKFYSIPFRSYYNQDISKIILFAEKLIGLASQKDLLAERFRLNNHDDFIVLTRALLTALNDLQPTYKDIEVQDLFQEINLLE